MLGRGSALQSLVTGKASAVDRASEDGYEVLRRRFRWQVPQSFNIGVDCSAGQRADLLALIDVKAAGEADRYTFGELSRLSDRLGNAFRGLGAASGDRIGIVLPQGIHAALAHLAAYKTGCVAVPLSVLFGLDALTYRLGDSGATIVCTNPQGLDKVLSVAGDLPDLKAVVVTEAATGDRRVVTFEEALASGAEDLDVAATSAEEPALLIYTSGTTGPPKGALHAHRALFGHLPGFELSHNFFPQDGDLFWTPADWAWIGGLMDVLLPSWHHGIPVVAATRERFDVDWAFSLMSEHRVRNTFIPPTALKMMRQSGARPPDLHLRTLGSGGEALGEEMLAWAREVLGVTVNEFYGQTEANLIVGNCSEAWPVRAGSMGRPYPGHTVEVQMETGERAPAGEAAEIVVRSPDPVMFLRYWNNPEATADKFRGEWLRTGDMAREDEDGYIWFEGRADDVINSAGYRIGPVEIEGALIRHDAVALAAVIGIPDEVRGEVVKAFIKLRDGVQPSEALEEEIRRHVRERVAAYQYPRVIEFVDGLPTTTTGKIQRNELRARESRSRPGA